MTRLWLAAILVMACTSENNEKENANECAEISTPEDIEQVFVHIDSSINK